MEFTVFLLAIFFLISLFIVCGKKGFRLFASLALTIIALIWIMTPLIVHGYNPELIVLIVGLPICAIVVYLTEGFCTLSHISVVAIILNFLFASALAYGAVALAGLTGLVSTDASFLGLVGINLQQLLVAGIMLGTLGILTEMVVTQVATVIEFYRAKPQVLRAELYRQSYSVGIAHLGSIVNTLFLVYAGVSFPLLIIYIGGHASLSSALNYEPLVSEIIRMLAGTIALIIAMPNATALAVWWCTKKSAKQSL
jgi:uncharacterized membrane protein